MVESSEGGIEIATTVCELGDASVADALRVAACAAGMLAQIDEVESLVRVTIEHADEQRASAENLVDIYTRAEAAGREWHLLDLIIKGPAGPR